MKINKINLTNFRNIDAASLDVSGASMIVLYGANGAGKTNLLEAISLLTPGRGLHKNAAEEHLQDGCNSWTIYSEVETRDEVHQVGMQYSGKKRTLKIDGDTADSQSDLAKLGHILWFTPKMDRLFMDGSSARRDFLDRLIFGHNPAYAETLKLYKHHVKSRLQLLKQGKDGDWVSIHEEQAANLAIELTKTRLNYLKNLKEYMPLVDLHCTGDIENSDLDDGFSVLEAFVQNRHKDGMYGVTHFGPHRSQLTGKLLIDHPAALHKASTGQHKRAVLEILLANTRLMKKEQGYSPIILFDEVTAHLDKKVRHDVFAELHELGTQIWLTGTEKELFSGTKKPLYFEVSGGSFTAQ